MSVFEIPQFRDLAARVISAAKRLALGALVLAVTSGAWGAPKSAEVRMANDRPTIFINGQPEYPMIYTITDLPGGRLTWEEMPQHNIRRMAEVGVRLFQFPIFFDQMWTDPDAPLDIAIAQKLIRGVTDVAPDAAIIIRLHVHPPQWWYARHPDECVRYADTPVREYDDAARFGRLQHNDPASGVIRYSLASRLWQETMTAKVAEFCRRLAATGEGNAVAGIQVAGGVYGEWHYWGFIDNEPDVSAPMREHFAAWLKAKYRTEEGLRSAWNAPGAKFDTVAVPNHAERNQSDRLFLDLATERNLVDYYECQHELVADTFIHFARTVKESWGRPVIVGGFYGYFFPVFSRETNGGHLALQKILDSPSVDFLAGPQCYFPDAREAGDPARSRGLTTSVRLHGKLWLDEYDTQPDIAALTPIGAGVQTPGFQAVVNTAVAVVKRNMAVSAVQGGGFWFFDFGIGGGRMHPEATDNGSNGWWDYPPLLQAIKDTSAIFRRKALAPYRSAADVLMVYDTDVYYEMSTRKDLLAPVAVTTGSMPASVWKAGVAADYLHLDDLKLINLDQYKVVVFNNTFRLTAEQRAIIRDKVLKLGRQVVWYYAPGYSDGKSGSRQNMEAATGFRLADYKPAQSPEVVVNHDGFSFRYGIGGKLPNPLFQVDDPAAETIGTYGAGGGAAIARKANAGATSWFVALPEDGGRLLPYILRKTPAHFYGNDGEIFYAGGGMLIMHSMKPGPHQVTLKNGKTVECDVPKGGATVVLDAETGEALHP